MRENKNEKFPNTLLLRVRSGDDRAFAELLVAYAPLIGAQVGRYAAGLCDEDVADLTQVARLALYRAALEFCIEQSEVSFGLYAKRCIANALVSQWRVITRRSPEVSVAEAPNDAAGEDPARRLVEEEAVAALRRRIRTVLSPYENRVWELYAAGIRSGEIARMLGEEAHSVENAVYRIRRKLRRALGEAR